MARGKPNDDYGGTSAASLSVAGKLGDAADQFSANSGFESDAYCAPVLGLILRSMSVL